MFIERRSFSFIIVWHMVSKLYFQDRGKRTFASIRKYISRVVKTPFYHSKESIFSLIMWEVISIVTEVECAYLWQVL